MLIAIFFSIAVCINMFFSAIVLLLHMFDVYTLCGNFGWISVEFYFYITAASLTLMTSALITARHIPLYTFAAVCIFIPKPNMPKPINCSINSPWFFLHLFSFVVTLLWLGIVLMHFWLPDNWENKPIQINIPAKVHRPMKIDHRIVYRFKFLFCTVVFQENCFLVYFCALFLFSNNKFFNESLS